MLIILAVFFYFSSNREQRVQIPYSKFKQQVREGNINKITIKGGKIRGEFKNSYKVKIDQEEVKGYQYFKTVKPQIEDAKLMDLLENNNVEIKDLIKGMEDKANKILKKNQNKLDDLASLLLEKETVEKDEVEEIIGDEKEK